MPFSGRVIRMTLSEMTLRSMRSQIDAKNKRRSEPVRSKLIAISPTGVLQFKSESITMDPGNRERWDNFIELCDWDKAMEMDDLNYFEKANLAVFGDVKVHCSCLTGDTQVPLLDGRTLTMEQIHAEFGFDKEFWVYSSDEKGDFVPARARSLGVTKMAEEIIEVELDDESKFRCTPDHPVRLRSGEYARADSLQPGDSLMPLYRSEGKGGYEIVQRNTAPGTWDYVHREVAKYDRGGKEDAFGRRPLEYLVVHHIDFNKRNNEPGNLRWMGIREHYGYHSKLAGYRGCHAKMRKDLADPEKRPNVIRRLSAAGKASQEKRPDCKIVWGRAGIRWVRENRALIADRMRRTWKNPSTRMSAISKMKEHHARPDVKEKYSRRMTEYWTDPEKREITKASMIRHYLDPANRESQRLAQEKAWACADLRQRHSAIMLEIASRPETKRKKSEASKKMWADPEYKEAMREKLREGWRRRREAMQQDAVINHSVVAVRRMALTEPVPVYDLSVEGTQNFLIANGIIVHNCPAFLYWGYEFIVSEYDARYEGEGGEDWEGKTTKEPRPPVIRNPNLNGIVCKHLVNVLTILTFTVSKVASRMKELDKTKKSAPEKKEPELKAEEPKAEEPEKVIEPEEQAPEEKEPEKPAEETPKEEPEEEA